MVVPLGPLAPKRRPATTADATTPKAADEATAAVVGETTVAVVGKTTAAGVTPLLRYSLFASSTAKLSVRRTVTVSALVPAVVLLATTTTGAVSTTPLLNAAWTRWGCWVLPLAVEENAAAANLYRDLPQVLIIVPLVLRF